MDRPLARFLGHALEQRLNIRPPAFILLEQHIFGDCLNPLGLLVDLSLANRDVISGSESDHVDLYRVRC